MLRTKCYLFALVSIVPTHTAFANPPSIQSDRPLVHLADNLDEKDQLGWCIDTQGRGYNEDLHAHSCKPAGRGEDTQFAYVADSGLIRSVPYGECVSLARDGSSANPFALRACDADDTRQIFVHDAESGELRLGTEPMFCVVVGTGSASAGPYMSRELNLARCEEMETGYKRWVVLN